MTKQVAPLLKICITFTGPLVSFVFQNYPQIQFMRLWSVAEFSDQTLIKEAF